MALAATPQQQQFITTYQPYAQDAGKQLGVDPNVILGQWAHETGFGTNLGTQHNNLGGMTAPTGQYYSYSDPQQFTDHYVQTLQSKYPQVLGTGSNANKFVTGLYQGHYFTGNPGDYVADVNNNASLAQTVLSQAPAAPASKFDQLLQQKGQEQQQPQGAPAQGAPGPDTSKFDQLLQQKAAEQSQPAPSQAPDPSVVSVGPTPGAPPPPAPAPTARPPLPGVSVGPDAWTAAGTPSPTADNPMSRIGQAATGAYEATPSILAPGAKAAVNQWTPGGLQLGRYIVNPLLDVAGAGVGAANALGAGIAQGAGELSRATTGDEMAARDALAVAQALPFGGWEGAMNPLRYPGAPPLTAPPPTPPGGFATAGTPAVPGESLARITGAIGRADTTPEGAVPTLAERTAAREPMLSLEVQPGSVGAAATPHTLSGITPKEEAMYRATQEGRRLLENQEVGVPDRTQYVPGSNPNIAEQEQTVNAARDLKALGINSTDAAQEMKLAAQENNNARTTYWEGIRGSEADKLNEEDARQADIEAAKPKVFGPGNVKGPVDMGPVVQQIDDTLNQPLNRQNSAMQKVLGPLRQRLVDDTGTPLQMDPEEAWGLRQDIDRMISDAKGANDAEARNVRKVGNNLNQVSGTIDNGIEAQAPGYSDMLQTYQQHSRRIDEMDVLQNPALNTQLFRGTGQTMNYSDFQRFMANVVKARSTRSTNLNPYKSITDDTMTKLWNLRDDLRRSASAMDLARAPGSDTFPNILDAFKQYAKLGGNTAVDALAEHFLPVVGPFMWRGIKAAFGGIQQGRTAARTMAQVRTALRPPNALTLPASAMNPLTGGPAAGGPPP